MCVFVHTRAGGTCSVYMPARGRGGRGTLVAGRLVGGTHARHIHMRVPVSPTVLGAEPESTALSCSCSFS